MKKGRNYPRLDESLLSHFAPFAKLNRKQIRTILDLATARHLDVGNTVFEAGTLATRFYILLDGHISVIRSTETGDKVVMLHIPAGQLFGIAQALGHTHYPATAMTASDSIVLSWPTALFDEFKTQYDGFAAEIGKTVGLRVEEISTRLVEIATQKVEQRVANAVARLVEQNGSAVDGGIEIDFPITRKDLSELTATTLHTASRLLSSWDKEGIVKSRRKHIIVCDPQRLRALAGEPLVE